MMIDRSSLEGCGFYLQADDAMAFSITLHLQMYAQSLIACALWNTEISLL